MKSFKIILKTLISIDYTLVFIYFLVFSSSCNSLKKNYLLQAPPATPNRKYIVFRSENESKKIQTNYYSEYYKIEFLILEENRSLMIRFFLGNFSGEILEQIKKIMMGNLPSYTVLETIYVGSPLRKIDRDKFLVTFQKVFHRKSHGSALDTIVEEYLTNGSDNILTKLVFRAKSKNTLWKEEEWVEENGIQRMWRNYDGEEILFPSTSLTEYNTQTGKIFSKIYSKSNFIYHIQNADPDFIPILNFSTGGLGWELVEDFPESEQKNSLPKLRFKKNLNQYGN